MLSEFGEGWNLVVRRRWILLALVHHAEQLAHFFVEEPFAWAVGLNPPSVQDELRDGAFSGMPDDFVGGSRRGFDIHFLERDVVLLKEALGNAAVGTPGG